MFLMDGGTLPKVEKKRLSGRFLLQKRWERRVIMQEGRFICRILAEGL